MTDCASLAGTATLAEIVGCSITLAVGGIAIASIIVFLFLMYVLWRMNVPFLVTVPLAVFAAYVFAGGGTGNYFSPIFQNIMWIIVLLIGVISVLVLWRFRI